LQQRASWPPSRGSCRLPEQPPRPQQPSAMTGPGYPAARVRTPRSPRSRSPSGRCRRSIPGPLHQPRGADGALPPNGREMVSLLTPAGGRALVASQRSSCQVGVAGVEVEPSPPRSGWTASPNCSGRRSGYGAILGRGSPCGSIGPIPRRTGLVPEQRPPALPVRLSDRALRYSAKGIDRWIGSRVGGRGR